MKNTKLGFVLFLFILSSCDKKKLIINDVTNINPIAVAKIIKPTTSGEISNILLKTKGPVSIGGGKFSMGGQTAEENSVHIDMRSFNKVIHLDIEKKQITVQSGIRWRDIQEEIDKHNLSVKIMQTYSNFTVGGSLSVNCHGRYVGAGPVIKSVESFKIILANGSEVKASRQENQDLFRSAIGGYGGIGVITEVTLNLSLNEKVRREIKQIKAVDYKRHFLKHIKTNPNAVFHNGDLYPPDYNSISMETWYRTTKPLTETMRLIPEDKKYWLEPNVISSISNLPFGADIRQKILDPIMRSKEIVSWRNHEASYDVAQLEPVTTRLLFTYVLQEYFIPVDKFNEFIPKMKKVFLKNEVNVLNVSIRHTLQDQESTLSWSPTDVFSFVIYYKQLTTDSAKEEVRFWSREMIDQILKVGGSYYLPYQVHATNKQFQKAYKNHKRFFEIKKKYDPTYKFRNKLWDEYIQK